MGSPDPATETSRPGGRWLRGGWGALLLVALGLLTWAPALDVGLETFDSPWLIRDNPLLNTGDPAAIGTVLLDFSEGVRRTLGSEYLPVRDLTVLADFALWGADWRGHHAQNLAWYLASCLLFWRLLLHLGLPAGRSLGIAAIFLVHPVHVESVAWLASRKDVISLFFFLLACLSWVADPRRLRALLTCLCCYVVAEGAKNTAIVLPGVLLLLSWVARRDDLRRLRGWWPFLPMGLLALGMVSLSLRVGDVVGMFAERRGGSLLGSMLLESRIVWRYLGMLAWPGHLAVLYPDPPVLPWSHPLSLAAVGGLLAVLVGTLGVARRAPLVALGVGWFGVTLLPVSQVVPIQNLQADRYLLLPSAGFLLVVGGVLAALPARLLSRPARIVLPLAVVGVLAVATHHRCRLWQSPLDLWADASARYPHDPRSRANLAGALVEAGRPAEAEAVLREGLQATEDGGLLQGLGWVLLVQGRADEAEAALRRALELEPDRARAANNLTALLREQGRIDEAVEVGRHLVEVRPLYPTGWNVLGAALLDARRLDEAEAALLRARELAPFDADPACNLGGVAWLRGDLQAAGSWWTLCGELEPGHPTAARGLEEIRRQSFKNTEAAGPGAP